MRSYQPSSDRRRALSLALTIAAHLLLVWLLIHLAPCSTCRRSRAARSPSTCCRLGIISRPRRRAPRRLRALLRRAAAPRPNRPPHPERPPTTRRCRPRRDAVPGYLVLSRNDFRASDVGKMPSTRSGGSAGKQLAAADGQGDGDAGETSASAGIGPGGQRLYAAEWYVRPSASQTGPYMPRELPAGSWGEIACKTAPNYRVEDCVQLGDSRPAWGWPARCARRRGSSRSARRGSTASRRSARGCASTMTSSIAIRADQPRARARRYVPSTRTHLEWKPSSSSARSTAGSPGLPSISQKNSVATNWPPR